MVKELVEKIIIEKYDERGMPLSRAERTVKRKWQISLIAMAVRSDVFVMDFSGMGILSFPSLKTVE